MEGELIYVAIIMQIGTLIALYVWSNLSLSKYFKKENFKTALSNTRATNKINLDKLRREMGLTPSKTTTPAEAKGTLGNLADLLPLLKNLDADQLGMLVDKFIGEGGTEEGGGDLTSVLMDYATKNPEIVQGLLEGLTKGKPVESVFNS